MKHRTLAILIAVTAIIALSATAVMAAKPANATGHGTAVSEVAKAVHTVSGNAHGKAVSAIAKAHGAAVSALARAHGDAASSAGKANGAAASEQGRLKAKNHPAGSDTDVDDTDESAQP